MCIRDRSDQRNVRLIPEWGGGSLWDIGVYPLSFAQYVMGGPPEWVFGDQRRGGAGVDVARLLYTSPSPRYRTRTRMPPSA